MIMWYRRVTFVFSLLFLFQFSFSVQAAWFSPFRLISSDRSTVREPQITCVSGNHAVKTCEGLDCRTTPCAEGSYCIEAGEVKRTGCYQPDVFLGDESCLSETVRTFHVQIHDKDISLSSSCLAPESQCVFGQCVNPQESYCVDSDRTNFDLLKQVLNYERFETLDALPSIGMAGSVQVSTQGQVETLVDKCKSKNLLVEYSCDGHKPQEMGVSCGKILAGGYCENNSCQQGEISSSQCPLNVQAILKPTEILPRDDNHNGVLDSCEFPQLVSVNDQGEAAQGLVAGGSLSGDGRYYVYTSNAHNLVEDDNGDEYWDVYLFDRIQRKVKRLNMDFSFKNSSWNEGPNRLRLSDDGKRLAVQTNYSDAPGSYLSKIFDYDLETDSVLEVYHGARIMLEGMVVSDNGQFIALSTINHTVGSNLPISLSIYEITEGGAQVVSQQPTDCLVTAISSNGQLVTCQKNASDEIAGELDLWDLASGEMTLIDSEVGFMSGFYGIESRDISFTKRHIDQCLGFYVFDGETHVSAPVDPVAKGLSNSGCTVGLGMSSDGRYVLFSGSYGSYGVTGDYDTISRIYVYDRETDQTEVVFTFPPYVYSNSAYSLSADGRFLFYRGAYVTINPLWTPASVE